MAFGQEYCSECLTDLRKLDSKQIDEESSEEAEEEAEVIDDMGELPVDDEESAPDFVLETIEDELSEESFDEDAEPLDEEGLPEEEKDPYEDDDEDE